MFNKKQKRIEELEKHVKAMARSHKSVQAQLINENELLRQTIEDFERTVVPAYDMNILFGAILDYKNIVRRLFAADPIIERPQLVRLFDKYNVKIPS